MSKTKSILLVILTLLPLHNTIPFFLTANVATAYAEYNGALGGAAYTIRIPSPIETWNSSEIGFLHYLFRG